MENHNLIRSLSIFISDIFQNAKELQLIQWVMAFSAWMILYESYIYFFLCVYSKYVNRQNVRWESIFLSVRLFIYWKRFLKTYLFINLFTLARIAVRQDLQHMRATWTCTYYSSNFCMAALIWNLYLFINVNFVHFLFPSSMIIVECGNITIGSIAVWTPCLFTKK